MKRGQVVLWGGWRCLGHVQYRSRWDHNRAALLGMAYAWRHHLHRFRLPTTRAEAERVGRDYLRGVGL